MPVFRVRGRAIVLLINYKDTCMTQSVVDLDPAATPEDLALQIVGLSDGTDMGSDCVGKLGRTLLTGKPEERNPLKYAAVFDLVRNDPKASPWMKYSAWAESVNGRRRAKGADLNAIVDELNKLADEAVAAVSASDSKNLLLGNVEYNLTIACRGPRRYEEGMRAARRSSAWFGLAGNAAKQDTSLFVAQVEMVSVAFVAGDALATRRACLCLVALEGYIEKASYPYPAWMADNAPIHIGWAIMMGYLIKAFNRGEHSSYFGRGEASRFAPWKRVFDTWRAYDLCEFDKVIATDPVDTPSSSLDNSTLTVRILVALAKRETGDKDGARAILEKVANHTGPDGGIPIAVAKSLLSQA